jgi:hypothetical protein
MTSVSLPGIICWGNPYSLLPGALGPSPSHGGGLRSPFLYGRAARARGPPSSWVESRGVAPAKPGAYGSTFLA